jgi:acyl carrier protein
MVQKTGQESAQRLAEIRDMAADIFSVDPEEVEQAESFVADLGADSLLAIEFVTQLEKRFGVTVDESEVPDLITNLEAAYTVVAGKAGW